MFLMKRRVKKLSRFDVTDLFGNVFSCFHVYEKRTLQQSVTDDVIIVVELEPTS